MKLHEVISLRPQQVEEPITDYQARLRDMRIKSLAGGQYSNVYNHPKMKKLVVKVSDDHEDTTGAWLEFMVKHQGNPYIPKLYDVRRYVKGNNTYFVAMIERLREYGTLPRGTKQKLIAKHLGEYGSELEPENVWDFLEDPFEMKLFRLQSSRTGVPSKQLMTVLEFIHRQPKGVFDLHDGNVMIRGKDQIVISDPLG